MLNDRPASILSAIAYFFSFEVAEPGTLASSLNSTVLPKPAVAYLALTSVLSTLVIVLSRTMSFVLTLEARSILSFLTQDFVASSYLGVVTIESAIFVAVALATGWM